MPACRADPSRWLRQANVARTENRPFIAMPEGRQALDLPNRLMRERRKRRLGVHKQFRNSFIVRNYPLGIRAERPPKRFDRRLVDGQSGGRFMSSMRHQMLAARSERRMQIEAGHATSRAHSWLRTKFIQRYEH